MRQTFNSGEIALSNKEIKELTGEGEMEWVVWADVQQVNEWNDIGEERWGLIWFYYKGS